MSRVPTNPSPPPSPPSMPSIIKAYALPLLLFSAAMFYQLFLIPNAFPPSHYDVLRIKMYSSIDEVKEAYVNLESKWNSDVEVSDVCEFLKIRYAYELLTNPLWKRDYDLFGIDEQLHIIESANKRYAGKSISELEFPLLHTPSSESIDHSTKVITASDFKSIFPDSKPWLIQLYSSGSNRCAEFSKSWNKIASLLDGFANTGVVELGEKEVAIYFADKRPTGKPFFRNGIPSLFAIPPGCRSAKCFSRFDGEPTIDAVTNWFATTVLALPQINYYTKESLVANFFGKSSHHKVKVIFFSKSGERASPYIRQVAKDYWAHASFAFILWREEESSYWLGAFGVESAPAIVFLKDPGVKPVVHHGSVDNSLFLSMMEKNKDQELPQLRSVTSMELGCDPRGYSRAGYDTVIWYCAIAVGRPSVELNRMRETICRVQDTLAKQSELDASSENESLAPVVDAFKRKRLTFAWLDSEKQKDYCQFYLGEGASEATCGQRKGMTDIPRLLVIRYLRNSSAIDTRTQDLSKWKSLLVQDLIDDTDQAGQFVAGYKGTADDSEITQWLSNIIKDGDSRDLPFFTLRTPKLVPDDTEPIWSKTAQQIPLKNIKQHILGVIGGLSVYLDDPRIGPFLLLAALISLGTIWLRRSQQVHLSQSKQPTQPSSTEPPSHDERKPRPTDRVRRPSGKKAPPSMTDFEPSDAYQMPLPDSDSD
ncbi:putative protein-disulfide reductase [Medicago truncatula]|uniref:DnaJ heat shock amino-terminal domain protein n=1 Tax=Medicago truncatula TaxID=3880 RepID=A0A072UTX8_MEDTR|nr:uncharacterized protein LOC25490387 [Medicago truncatula]KEH33294.1 DnaJ heat shock amino-terminal domain protein [Medicago truncatula]RHN66512.1 putative protein-disulfide reductase [Medicago truncatula]